MRSPACSAALAIALALVAAAPAPAPPSKRVYPATISGASIAPDGKTVLVTYVNVYDAASLLHQDQVLLSAVDGKELLTRKFVNLPTVFVPGGKQLLSGGINNFPWPGNPPPPGLEV